MIMLTIHDEYEWNFMIIAKKHLFTKIKMMLIKGIWNPPKLNPLEKYLYRDIDKISTCVK